MKNKKQITAWFLLLMLLYMAGCAKPEDAPNPSDTDTENLDQTSDLQDAEPLDKDEAPEPEIVYAQILDNYKTALSQGYDMGQLRDAGLNYLCAYYDNPSEIGYAFLDIDGNDTVELLIADGDEYEGGDGCFFDLYTAIDGNPILVAQSTERDRFYLCSDGAIANEGSSGATDTFSAYYNIGDQGQLILSEAVIYDEEYGNDSFWYSTSAISAEGASQLSQDSADLIFQKHAHVPINLTPILPAGSVPAPESPPTPAPAPEPTPEPAPTPAVTGEYDDIVGTYIDENQDGFFMFIGYEDSSKATACIALALVQHCGINSE